MNNAALLAVAQDLIGTSIHTLHSLDSSGRNARVFRIESSKGCFALKQYPPTCHYDRFTAEKEALLWMGNLGITSIPHFVAGHPESRVSLLTWVEGITPTHISEREVESALHFLRLIFTHSANTTAINRLACEACLSAAEIEHQIHRRLTALQALRNEKELQAFLDTHFNPTFQSSLKCARDLYAQSTNSFERPLPRSQQSLVPSDFGFHNTLLTPGGHLSFIDFEYFGWDDPVKLVCDLLLHPGYTMDSHVHSLFEKGLFKIYGEQTFFKDRFQALFPLFALRWTLILLNEFLPEKWAQRLQAGYAKPWVQAKKDQLEAAHHMLKKGAS